MRICLRVGAYALAPVISLWMADGQAHAAPSTFNTALPVSEGHAVARQQIILADAKRNEDRLDETALEGVLGYGMTPDLALFVSVPYFDRELEPAGEAMRRSSGFGDTRVSARYTALRFDWSGRTLRIAPFAGVELPTGKDAGRDAVGPRPSGLQPGSGSLDLLGGVVASYASLDWNLDAQLAWQDNREANMREASDVFRADLSVHKRLLPGVVGVDTKGFLFGGIEINYRDVGRSSIAGLTENGTDSQSLFVAPILQYAASRWIFEAALQLPVTQTGGTANFKQGHVLRFGLRAHL